MSKKVKQNYNSYFIERHKISGVLFNVAAAHIVKSATAGLLISQLLYWWGKGKHKEFFYKTIAELYKETGLTRSQQEIAIKKWKALGVLSVELHDVPPKRHFKINLYQFDHLLQEYLAIQFAESSKLNSLDSHHITESTQETTPRDLDLQSYAARAP